MTQSEQVEVGHERGQWKSRWGFILAAAGSAVGLGNIWKFPYITGVNGGGLFVAIYLACIALVGIPIMTAEIMIGRATRRQPVAAFRFLQGRGSPWTLIGWLGVVTGFMILSYYIVVAGWAVEYTGRSLLGFAKPLVQEAEAEADTWLAQASLDEIRATLAQQRATRRAGPGIEAAKNLAKPSVWKAYEDHAKLAATPVAQANALATDPLLGERVAIAQRLFAEHIEPLEREALGAAAQHYAALAEPELRAEARTERLRKLLAGKIEADFEGLSASVPRSLLWAALFMLVTILIVSAGVARGIETACKVLMPTLLIIMLIMVGYACFQPGFPAAFAFVFHPNAHNLHASGVLEALGHSFFTLSLGMGAMITYGSYQATRKNLTSQAITIAALDTGIALLACLMMFPILFTCGLPPGAGPGLAFVSMPLAFAQLGAAGQVLATLFFGLLVFAALTSSISLLEVVGSYFIDERRWSRRRAVWTLGGLGFLIGIPSAIAACPGLFEDKNFFDTVDYLATNWMLPLGGLFIALYAGWVMPARLRDAQLEGLGPGFVRAWLLAIRFVCPVLVLLVFLQTAGFLNLDELLGGLGP